MSKPKIKAYHFGRIEGWNLKLSDRPKFQCALNALEGQEIRLTIERKPAQRKNSTRSQREYYWPVICGMIGDFIGISKEEAHDLCKARFLSIKKDFRGQIFTIVRSTESLSTIEREDYHQKIREWASRGFPEEGEEFGGIVDDVVQASLYIPLPNEADYQ